MAVARSFSGDTKVLDDNMLYIIYSEPINIQGDPKSWTFFNTPYLWNHSRKNETDFTKMFPGFLGTKIRS